MPVEFVGGPARLRRGDGRGREDGPRRQGQQGHRPAPQPPRPAGRRALRRRRRGCSACARQAAPSGEDIGFVGQIDRVDVDVLDHIAQDYIPVIASVGADREGNSYNVNADEAAGAVARAIGAYKVMFLTDVEGWLRDPADPAVGHLRGARRRGRGRAARTSSGGMRPKLAGVRRRDPRRRELRPHRRRPRRRTRCCSSCSPTPASARRSGPRHEPAEHQLEREHLVGAYARMPVRVRARRGRAAVGRRGQRVPRLPDRPRGRRGRALPPGRRRGDPRAGRTAHPRRQPLLHRARCCGWPSAWRSGSLGRQGLLHQLGRRGRRGGAEVRAQGQAAAARSSRCTAASTAAPTARCRRRRRSPSRRRSRRSCRASWRSSRPPRRSRGAVDEQHRRGDPRADAGRERRLAARRRACWTPRARPATSTARR